MMLGKLVACSALANICTASAMSGPQLQRPLNSYHSHVMERDSRHGCVYGCDDIAVADEALETYIVDLMERGHVPGLAIAILDGNKTWAKGFGHAIINDTRVTPSTLFHCGSTTKSFTAAAISLLTDNSQNYSSIQWDSPVIDFLREDWVLSDAWATEHVTLQDALSHRTGYPRHDFSMIPADSSDMVRNFRNLPMSAEPRVKFQYCNLMFGAMGYLVSKLTDSWLGDFFRERLWEPMGMKSTYLALSDAKSSGLSLADVYWYNNDTNAYETLPHEEFAWEEGAGMVISNVLDYSRYMRTMMNEALPLSKAGHAALKTANSIVSTKMPPFTGPVYYGLGWFGGIFAGEEVWFHGGQVNGHISNMIMVPSRQFAVVTMLNTASWAQDVLFFKVLYDYLGVGQEKRFDVETALTMQIKVQEHMLATCPQRLYPSVPDPPLKRPVSFDRYTGDYDNAGYGTLTVSLDCGRQDLPQDTPASPTMRKDGCRLVILKQGQRMPMELQLQHVSGDYWIGWVFMGVYENYHRPIMCLRVQFAVDAAGKVSRVGVDARLEGENIPLVWFERTSS